MRGNPESLKGKGFDVNPQNINRKGRPKKPVLQMKVEGYKLAEINDTIQMLCSMNSEELKEVLNNSKATILEKTVAAALKKGIERGELVNIETLLNRVYGKPKEKMDITTNGENITTPKIEIEIIRKNIEDQNQ